MQELIQKVQEKTELEEQILELEQLRKQLRKDVFDLRISANNEQYEAEQLEGFSVKGLLLQLSGKKEERLEKERREARNAKTKYEFATARLASIEQQLAEIPVRLQELGDCDEMLLQKMGDKLTVDDWIELSNRLNALQDAQQRLQELQTSADELVRAVEELQSWVGADRRSILTASRVHSAEKQAENGLNDFVGCLFSTESLLAELELPLYVGGFHEYDGNYLTDNLFGQMNRCIDVLTDARSIQRQIKTLLPKLEAEIRIARIQRNKLLLQSV